MRFITIPAGAFEVNTYLVWDNKNEDKNKMKDGFIIDPGGQEKRIEKLVEENSINLRFILNTHCHIDHVAMDNYFKKKFNIPLYANKEEEIILANLKDQAEYLGLDFKEDVVIDKYLIEGEIINAGSIRIKPIFTPGHSPGSTSFLMDEGYLFSGDTLFKQTIGRTDLLGGSFDKIIDSIKNRLFLLNDDVVVLPGHGDKTTIRYEKRNNAYLYGHNHNNK